MSQLTEQEKANIRLAWFEATIGGNPNIKRRLKRNDIASLKISELCQLAIQLHTTTSLGKSARLMYGISRLNFRQASILYEDAVTLQKKIDLGLVKSDIDLKVPEASYRSITLEENINLYQHGFSSISGENDPGQFVYLFDRMGPVEYSMSSFERRTDPTLSESELSLRELPSEFLIHTFDMDQMKSELQNISHTSHAAGTTANVDDAGPTDVDLTTKEPEQEEKEGEQVQDNVHDNDYNDDDGGGGLDFDFDIGQEPYTDIGESSVHANDLNVLNASMTRTDNMGQENESIHHRIESFNISPHAPISTAKDPNPLSTQNIATLVPIPLDQNPANELEGFTGRRRGRYLNIQHPGDIILSIDFYNSNRITLPDIYQESLNQRQQLEELRVQLSKPSTSIQVDNLHMLFQRKNERLHYLRTVETARIGNLNYSSSIRRDPVISHQTLRSSPERTTSRVDLGDFGLPSNRRRSDPITFERSDIGNNEDQDIDMDFDVGDDLYFNNQQDVGVHNLDSPMLLHQLLLFTPKAGDIVNLNELLASKTNSEKAMVFYNVLELAVENKIEIRQEAAYEPIDVRFK